MQIKQVKLRTTINNMTGIVNKLHFLQKQDCLCGATEMNQGLYRLSLSDYNIHLKMTLIIISKAKMFEN